LDAESEKGSRRPNPIDVHVGGRVRFRRMLLGMSQEKLGEKLGLTFQQVQKYEKGINRIGASRLFDLAQVLGVSVQFFYEEAPSADAPQLLQAGFGEKPAEGSIVEFLRSRDGLELNKAFVRISDVKARPRHRRSCPQFGQRRHGGVTLLASGALPSQPTRMVRRCVPAR
jgi:transcriptional regulator with XRE-family HTH domain